MRDDNTQESSGSTYKRNFQSQKTVERLSQDDPPWKKCLMDDHYHSNFEELCASL